MNFYKTFDTDYLYCGRMDLPWENIEQDLKRFEKETYGNHNISGQGTVNNDNAYQSILDQHKKYGYTEHNTVIWKSTACEPKLTFSWEQKVVDQLPLSHAVVALTRQNPGQVLPWHEDRFFMLRKQHPENTAPIWRFLLMMQDWKIGHFLQINNTVFTHWSQGDLVVWHPGTMHLAANVGLEPKWTCNITGFLTV